MEKLSLTILFLIITLNVNSQTFEQADNLVEDFFNKKIKRYKSVLDGEAKKQDYNPKNIPEDSTFEFLKIRDDKETNVFAVQISTDDKVSDIYVFLEKVKNDWKIIAFRSLWLPPFYYEMLNEYNGLNDEQLEIEYEKLFVNAKKSNDTISKSQFEKVVGTKSEFIYEVKNMRLTVKSDSELINHFNDNENEINEIKSNIKFEDDKYMISGKKSEFKSDFQKTGISLVKKNNSMLLFVIGGMIDNEVGYMFCPNPSELPTITDRRFIMIREIGKGWYLYKTT